MKLILSALAFCAVLCAQDPAYSNTFPPYSGAGGSTCTGTSGQILYADGSSSNCTGAATGTGVKAALGVNTGSAGAFVVYGGALGTPSSGTGTNIAGIPLANIINGTQYGVIYGGGAGSAPGVTAADATTTHAFFATAGAPAFRAIAAGDIPTLNQNTSGNAATATAATNLAGGAAGSLPYQTAAATTAFLSGYATGTQDAVLVSTSVSGAYSSTSLKNAPTLSAANMTNIPVPAGICQGPVTKSETSTYQVLAADFSNCTTIIVPSGTFTITLVASGSQPATGQQINIINYGSGTVTIARSGQNINAGTATLILPPIVSNVSNWASIVSDGTNYEATLGGATINIPACCTGPSWANNSSTFTFSNNFLNFTANGGNTEYIGNNKAPGFTGSSTDGFGLTSGAAASTNIDTNWCRGGTGIWYAGTAACGSANTGASVELTNVATVTVATASLKTCTASTGVPWRAAVNDATTPALGVALTGGGSSFALVHCSLTSGTYLVDGL